METLHCVLLYSDFVFEEMRFQQKHNTRISCGNASSDGAWGENTGLFQVKVKRTVRAGQGF